MTFDAKEYIRHLITETRIELDRLNQEKEHLEERLKQNEQHELGLEAREIFLMELLNGLPL